VLVDLSGLSLAVVAAAFAIFALAIGLAGTRLAHVADTLADRTGMGEILAGALFVGGSTSLPGIIASVSAALDARPSLAAANAVGGIAAQTAFIAVADLFYRRANLEHDAADLGNVVQSLVLLGMLTLPLVAALCPLAADWPEASVGALAVAVITSLPELVTTVAAVRRGALGIAFGGIMGGNAFDVLFLAASDVAYTDASIYHAAGDAVWFQLALTCTMVAILVLGLTLRQRRGPANIGFESTLVLGCYLLGATAIALWPAS